MIDIKRYWNIDPISITGLPCHSPFSSTTFYLINNTYLLRGEPNSEKIRQELELAKYLEEKGIKTLQPIKGPLIQDSRSYSLFDYFPNNKSCEVPYDKDIKQISNQLGILSKIKKELNYVPLSIKQINNDIYKKAYKKLTISLFPFLKYFNKTFSHGDFHPGNLLWQDKELKAIIDWELASKRDELYDLAFFIGCIGIDNPQKLTGSVVTNLIKHFTKDSKPSKLAFTLLPELVLAARLQWYDRWLQTEDKEIQDMELKLIEILTNNLGQLRKNWLGSADTDFKYSKNRWVMQDTLMVEDINKAKLRMLEPYKDTGQKATDLRLLMIDYGMQDDIINLIKTLHELQSLPNNPPTIIEKVIAMGNSCLDFSKYQMADAIQMTIKQVKNLIEKHDIPELNIGYAFCLRNASIAYAETHQINRSLSCLEDLARLHNSYPYKEIAGEYARALSNAITTMLNDQPNNDSIKKYSTLLESLYLNNKDSKKIHGAYQIAKANLNKFDLKQKTR